MKDAEQYTEVLRKKLDEQLAGLMRPGMDAARADEILSWYNDASRMLGVPVRPRVLLTQEEKRERDTFQKEESRFWNVIQANELPGVGGNNSDTTRREKI